MVGDKYLKRSLVSVLSFRRYDKESEVILEDYSNRNIDELEWMRVMGRELGYEYRNKSDEIVSGYFDNNRYSKLLFLKYHSIRRYVS